MQLKSGYPFSLIRSGLVHDYPKLERNLRTDVVVLGGGISGALTAIHLIRDGIPCIVVDRRSIGLGSTCASSSLLQYELDTPLHRLIELIGYAKAVRSYQLCTEAVDKLVSLAGKIGFTRIGKKKSLYYAASRRDVRILEKEFTARKEAGLRVEFLGKEDVSRIGLEAPAAILSQQGGQTDAYLLTHALHQYGIEIGLQVFDRTNVVSIDHKKKNVTLKLENGYTIEAKKIVYATGYESVKYIDKRITKLTSTYVVISEPIYTQQSLWKEEMLLWNTADPYLYMRVDAGKAKRIMVGGRDENFYSPAKRDILIKKKTKQLTKDFTKAFPHLEFIPEFSWTGTFASTKDGLPYIGEYPKLTNGYFALGFGGNGIIFSLIAAELITASIRGARPDDLEIFSFTR